MQGPFVAALFAASLVSCLAQAPAPAVRSPVSKVVTLLKEMKTTLEKEANEDEAIYDKLACWCQTNDKEKSKAIADAEARILDLQATVEQLIAQSERLKVEIGALQKEVAKEQKSLASASALREKEAAEFTGEEKEMVESVKALDAAIIVLSKHHPGAALLSDSEVRAVREQMEKHKDLLEGVVTPAQRRVILGLAQQGEGQPWQQSYTPQSGQVFGILKQMKETFEANLSDSQKAELAKQQAYAELKAAKEDEIAASVAGIDDKTQLLATTDENLAQAREDIDDTTASLSADEKFLMDLKKRCQLTDQEWEERTKMRQEELSAIAEAIAILTSDEARETFSRTFNPGLLQRGSQSRDDNARRSRAVALLLAVANKSGSPKLAALASRVQLDSFSKVKEAIDDMVAMLLREKADEIQHRDMCIGDFHENVRSSEAKAADKGDLETSLKGLAMAKEELQGAIEVLKAEIVDLKKEQEKAAANREAENAEFQATIGDQKETQHMLSQAIEVLKSTYASKKAGITMVQLGRADLRYGPPPPPGLDTYRKHQGAGGVIAMLEQILTDAKLMEKEATEAEADANRAFQSFMGKTDTSIKEKLKSIVNKSEDLAKAEQEVTTKTSELEDVEAQIEDLGKEKAALHGDCDFILKHFEERQSARDEEVDALRQTKAILSGMQVD